MWELVPVIAFFGLLGLIGYVMYKLLRLSVLHCSRPRAIGRLGALRAYRAASSLGTAAWRAPLARYLRRALFRRSGHRRRHRIGRSGS